jgi:hypothetical protein
VQWADLAPVAFLAVAALPSFIDRRITKHAGKERRRYRQRRGQGKRQQPKYELRRQQQKQGAMNHHGETCAATSNTGTFPERAPVDCGAEGEDGAARGRGECCTAAVEGGC